VAAIRPELRQRQGRGCDMTQPLCPYKNVDLYKAGALLKRMPVKFTFGDKREKVSIPNGLGEYMIFKKRDINRYDYVKTDNKPHWMT